MRTRFGTVASYCVASGGEEALLMSFIIVLESVCQGSAGCHSASMWAFVQGFEIFFRRCPC